jgi:hypothetical protein
MRSGFVSIASALRLALCNSSYRTARDKPRLHRGYTRRPNLPFLRVQLLTPLPKAPPPRSMHSELHLLLRTTMSLSPLSSHWHRQENLLGSPEEHFTTRTMKLPPRAKRCNPRRPCHRPQPTVLRPQVSSITSCITAVRLSRRLHRLTRCSHAPPCPRSPRWIRLALWPYHLRASSLLSIMSARPNAPLATPVSQHRQHSASMFARSMPAMRMLSSQVRASRPGELSETEEAPKNQPKITVG